MRLLGLSGYAKSGKDTVGKHLVEEHGFVRIAFADSIKKALLALDPIIYSASVGTGPGPTRVSNVIDALGWDEAKVEIPEVRELLQRLGTEVGRNLLGEDIWVEAAFKNLDPEGSYVITDMRFPNEWHAVKVRRGYVVRIRRRGVEAANMHISETALDDHNFDAYLSNNTTIAELLKKVDDTVDWFWPSMKPVNAP